MTQVLVLMTTHNRCETTVKCLDSLMAQQGLGDHFQLTIVVVDAGSSDGTVPTLSRRFPDVRVVQEGNHLYWAGGMRRAAELSETTRRDFDLWLNDDVVLRPDALATLLEASAHRRDAILVGQLVDGEGNPSYGGMRKRMHPLQLRRMGVTQGPEECSTFNGNVVLIPRDISRVLGPIDAKFIHGMGDIDYGLRAARAGYTSVQVPGYVGWCDPNSPGICVSRSSGLSRMRAVAAPKMLPFGAWWTLCRRYCGPVAPVIFAKPYVVAFIGKGRRTPS